MFQRQKVPRQSSVSAYQEFFFGVPQVEVGPSLLAFDSSRLLSQPTSTLPIISGRAPEQLLPKLKVQLFLQSVVQSAPHTWQSQGSFLLPGCMQPRDAESPSHLAPRLLVQSDGLALGLSLLTQATQSHCATLLSPPRTPCL